MREAGPNRLKGWGVGYIPSVRQHHRLRGKPDMSIDKRLKHIVITGPTAGIGRASALSLARDGADLTFLCRNLEKGEALALSLIHISEPTRPY